MVETKPTHFEASNVHAILDTNNVDSVHLTLINAQGQVIAIINICKPNTTTHLYSNYWDVAK